MLESPPFNSYEWHESPKKFWKYNPIQEINVSLAIQLVNFWINQHKSSGLYCIEIFAVHFFFYLNIFRVGVKLSFQP